MENETLSKSLDIRSPKLNCYKTIEAENLKIKPEKGSPVFKLFSKKCKSENQCLALIIECPIKAGLQNKHN